MVANKPKVWAIIDKHCATGVILIQHGHEKLVDGDRLIRLSDYEDLQAECEAQRADHKLAMDAACGEVALLETECEKLRKDAERFRTIRDRLAGPTFDKHFFLELYNVGAFDQPQSR